MSVDYSHEQFGTFMVAFTTILGLAVCLVLVAAGAASVAPAVALVSFVLVIVFFRLRVEVSPEHLRVRFGMGLVGRTFDVSEIVEVHPARHRWYYGWGIRLTPRGWLYNVSGFDVVEVHMRGGKRFRIGTDEPETLTNALRRAIGA